ncbi:protein phosphatase 2C family protein [Artemisia annua]|uniref:Protein phosphatase 2C family protein n=1 Tax=Artemisia annua TaxID=35608 RepID=A0A2U1N9U7_ARTAN|nr:protein phosphatase 2C family protein [Artemisia annua]
MAADELQVENKAVLSRKGKADAFTNDHKASHEDDRKRIQAKGRYVELHPVTRRVHGVLAVSRVKKHRPCSFERLGVGSTRDRDFTIDRLLSGLECGACCRAVRSRKRNADAFTNDHKASHEDERKRIQAKGRYVELHPVTRRVHGVLAVSRSIDDAHLKDWVLGVPEAEILPLTDDLAYLVLPSDGLWDEVSHPDVV